MLECEDGDPCTDDFCNDNLCVHEPNANPDCYDPILFTVNFNDGTTGGFDFVNSDDLVGWTIDDYRYHSYTYSLYYGNPDTRNYHAGDPDFGEPNYGFATSPLIHLPADKEATLDFWVYLDIESDWTAYDLFDVMVIDENGVETAVWSKPANQSFYKNWQHVLVSLADFIGQDIKIRFAFDTVDAILNETEGIYVDDIVVKVAP